MKFSVIYADPLARPRALDLEAESFDAIRKEDIQRFLEPPVATVYGVVDYEGQRMIPAVMDKDGILREVPDGDYGILTPSEWFEENAVAPMESSECD